MTSTVSNETLSDNVDDSISVHSENPIDPVVAEAEAVFNNRIETMDIETAVYALYHDYLLPKPIPPADSSFTGTFRLLRSTSTELGGFYLCNERRQPVVLSMIGEIAYSPDHTRMGHYFNMYCRDGERLTLDSLKRAHASMFVKPIQYPTDSAPGTGKYHFFHRDRAEAVIHFVQHMLQRFEDEKRAEDNELYPGSSSTIPFTSCVVASHNVWGLHLKSQPLFQNIPAVIKDTEMNKPIGPSEMAMSPNEFQEKRKKQWLENFTPKTLLSKTDIKDVKLGHLFDPEGHFIHLASQHDLTNLQIAVPNWVDEADEHVHMRHYSLVFKSGCKVYVEFKIQLYNIVQGPGGQRLPRPSRIASAIVQHIRLLPDHELDARTLSILLTRQAKENEEQDRELQRQLEADRDRMLDNERKRLADEEARTAGATEKKKQKLEEARRGRPSHASPSKGISNATASSTSSPSTSMASTSSNVQPSPVGNRMTTGGKPPKKVSDKSKSKPKTARAMEKQRAVEDNADVETDLFMDMNIN
ncbi:hypothetical protein F5878DRAFT_666948 [Lentinula raphanica]|uniref:Uncharacterized protein n=1 Tax=Lentinula raphanica TaxID=153919 RepID=A0AA38NWW0_9AGAR|nr:hypothetical protein F5878DRAFT_666948 [Lentinula raphanica]